MSTQELSDALSLIFMQDFVHWLHNPVNEVDLAIKETIEISKPESQILIEEIVRNVI